MAMKKIKPQYGKVVPPVIVPAESETPEVLNNEKVSTAAKTERVPSKKADVAVDKTAPTTSVKGITAVPNPFRQTKDVYAKANLTKIGYRMRSEYVEVLDIIKRIKKGGYTLEAVLDDALTFYFENSPDGKEAIKKAELFYS